MSMGFEKLPLSIKTNDEYITASSVLDCMFRKLFALKKINFNSSFEKSYYINLLNNED